MKALNSTRNSSMVDVSLMIRDQKTIHSGNAPSATGTLKSQNHIRITDEFYKLPALRLV